MYAYVACMVDRFTPMDFTSNPARTITDVIVSLVTITLRILGDAAPSYGVTNSISSDPSAIKIVAEGILAIFDGV
jgi:hypothetical protein